MGRYIQIEPGAVYAGYGFGAAASPSTSMLQMLRKVQVVRVWVTVALRDSPEEHFQLKALMRARSGEGIPVAGGRVAVGAGRQTQAVLNIGGQDVNVVLADGCPVAEVVR